MIKLVYDPLYNKWSMGHFAVFEKNYFDTRVKTFFKVILEYK